MNDLVEMILLYIAKYALFFSCSVENKTDQKLSTFDRAPFALFGGGVIFFALLFFLCACYWLIAGRVVWVIRDIKKKREPVPVGYYSVARNGKHWLSLSFFILHSSFFWVRS
jgi:protein-S-isoprenylcysteine O-methyltransferase Ste14